MIDTVRYRQSRIYSYRSNLAKAACGAHVFLPGFTVKPSFGADSVIVTHTQTRLRTRIWGSFVVWVEVSLPKVLFGHNGRLLSSQDEIDSAFRRVDRILDRFSTGSNHGREFSRVDLVWQFKGDPKVFANAHRDSRHPMIHRSAIDYGGNQLVWQGSKLRIGMYDKVLEQTRKRTGDVMRVEIQLRGDRLRKVFGLTTAMTHLDFLESYRTYRSIIRKFSPKPVPRVSRPVDLIAFAATRHSVNLWPHWKGHFKNSQALSRARRELLARKLKYSRIDWSELLPAKRPFWKAETGRVLGRTAKIALVAHA